MAPNLKAKLPEDRSLFERPAWEEVAGVWQPVYGSYFSQQVSMEWHDFLLYRPLDWARSFHPGSIEICLNFSGQGKVRMGNKEIDVGPQKVLVYSVREDAMEASRVAGSAHRFITVELSPEWLLKQCAEFLEGLRPEIRAYLKRPEKGSGVLSGEAMPALLADLRMHLVEPPVFPAALPFWFQSKLLEVLALTIFQAEKGAELFCDRHKRVNRDRIELVKYLLERDMGNPPSLEMLAKEAGCSPFYLSRLFAERTGVSIPKYLRKRRLEKAAELLLSGNNVTEAASAVGYSSLSAFSKAFVEEMGCCPGLYAVFKTQRKA